MNNITIEGIISRISNKYQERNITFFEVARNNKYIKDGSQIKDTSYFSVVIDNKLLINKKDLLKVGKKVVVSGIPNSYFDSSGHKCFTIKAFNIESEEEYKKITSSGPIISFDIDGVLLWNGKRCESKPMDPKEEQEIKDMLAQY